MKIRESSTEQVSTLKLHKSEFGSVYALFSMKFRFGSVLCEINSKLADHDGDVNN